MSQNSELRVPYGLSVHGEEEIEAVIEVLRTTTQMSKNVSSFEGKIAELFSMDYGVMVNSGSSALYVLIESLNLPKGSEVITPALTFATTVGCLVKNDLKPNFVDVGLDTYCADLTQIASAINPNTLGVRPSKGFRIQLADKKIHYLHIEILQTEQ